MNPLGNQINEATIQQTLLKYRNPKSPIPQHLRDLVYNPNRPFEISPEVLGRLAENNPDQLHQRITLVADDPEYKFVEAFFNHSPPPDKVIAAIEYIHNPITNQNRFEGEAYTINGQATNPFFAPTWENEPLANERARVIERWRSQCDPFSPFQVQTQNGRITLEHTRILPFFHGASERAVNGIANTGFAIVNDQNIGGANNPNLDEGYFGRGPYFTNSSNYATRYAYLQRPGQPPPVNPRLLVGWVAMRVPYPVVKNSPFHNPNDIEDIAKLRGHSHYRNYNAHFIPVTPVQPATARGTDFYPCLPHENPFWDEYVVFQPTQILPQFVLTLEPKPIPENLDDVTPQDLIIAAIEGHLELIRQAVELDRRRLQTTGPDQKSLMYYAAQAGQLHVVQYLHEEDGGLISQTTAQGELPIHAAVAGGHIGPIKWIHARREGDFKTKIDGYTLLHKAAEEGQEEAFVLLIELCPELVTLPNEAEWSPAQMAARENKVKILERIYDTPTLRSLLTQRNQDGKNTLHAAAIKDSMEAFLFLNERFPTLIFEEYQFDGKIGYTTMHLAAASGAVRVMEWIQNHPEEPIKRLAIQLNSHQQTPLHLAARFGNSPSTQYLLVNTNQVTAQDRLSETPLHLAIKNNQSQIVRLIAEHMEDPFITTSNGTTIIQYCAEKKSIETSPEILRIILEKLSTLPNFQIRMKMRDGGNQPVLFLAAPNPEKVKILLDFGAEINSTNTFGYTSLHWTAVNGFTKSAAVLIEGGADKNLLNQNHQSALYLACFYNHIELAYLLIGEDIHQFFLRSQANIPTSLENAYSYYVNLFRQAHASGEFAQQIFYLERAAYSCLMKENDERAVQCLNTALEIAKKEELDPAYTHFLGCQLEIIEAKYSQQLFGNKVPAECCDYILKYQTRLAALENAARLELSGPDPLNLSRLNESIKELLKSLVEQALEQAGIKGQLPQYAILCSGSLGRNEGSFTSGIELAVICEKATPGQKGLLENLLRLLRIKILNLGQTPFEVIGQEVVGAIQAPLSLLRKGISLSNTNGDFQIGTSKELTNLQKKDFLEQNPNLLPLANQMLSSSHLFGDETLLKSYHEAVESALFGGLFGRLGSIQNVRAKLLFDRLDQISAENLDLYNTLQTMIMSLIIYHRQSIKGSTLEQINTLRNERKIPEALSSSLSTTLEQILQLRIRTELLNSDNAEELRALLTTVNEFKATIQNLLQ